MLGRRVAARWAPALFAAVVASACGFAIEQPDPPERPVATATQPSQAGPSWVEFKNRAQQRLITIEGYKRFITGEDVDEIQGVLPFARELDETADRELDRLRDIEAEFGGVPACYADAAAAYSRAISWLSSVGSHAVAYYTSNSEQSLSNANLALEQAAAELREWERQILLADAAC